MAGVRAIRRNERQAGAARTPILALAAGAAAAAKALAAGADLHVAPPIASEALLAALACALSHEADELIAA
jgi:CheY-like chemotaxis protein